MFLQNDIVKQCEATGGKESGKVQTKESFNEQPMYRRPKEKPKQLTKKFRKS